MLKELAEKTVKLNQQRDAMLDLFSEAVIKALGNEANFVEQPLDSHFFHDQDGTLWFQVNGKLKIQGEDSMVKTLSMDGVDETVSL
jgi:hypothetical protein